MTSEKNSNPTIMSLHSFHKNFSSIRAFVDVGGKTKYCVSCSNTATQEVIFAADGASGYRNLYDVMRKKRI